MRVAMVSIFSRQRHLVGVQEAEVAAPIRAARLRHRPDGPREILRARATVGEVRGDDGVRAPAARATSRTAATSDGGVGREGVDGRHDRHAVEAHVLDLLGQVRRAAADGLGVLGLERRVERLAGHDAAHAAVHLERPDGGHDDRRRRAGCHPGGT